jgi:uncharacterized protein YuzB (UPF0349 family)
MKIRFCENNKGKGKVFRRLSEEHPDLDVKIKKCLGECKRCEKGPFALVDKVRVTGADGDELYGKIAVALRDISGKKEKA